MRRSATSPDPQPTPLQSRWFLLIAVLIVLGSAVSAWQPSWAQSHQDALRGTVPTSTPTYTPGPTSTPTQTAEPGVARILLRNEPGVYSGTMDTTINSYAPDVPNALDGGLQIKGGEGKSILIRYELAGQLPAGANIVAAELVLFVESPAGSTPRVLDVGAFRVLQDWEASSVCWNRVSTVRDVAWGIPGCNEAGLDRVGEADDVIVWEHVEVYRGFDVTASVAYWAEHPEENFGWLVKGVSSSTGSYSIPSSRASSLDERPVLRIDYVMGGITPSPTATGGSVTPSASTTPSATQTPSATAEPTVVTLEAAADTYLDSWAPDDAHGGLGYMRLRSSNIQKPLVWFDLSSLAMSGYDIHIMAASLEMTTGSTDPTQPMDTTVHRVLSYWDEATATWNHSGIGEGWHAPGASGSEDIDANGSGPITLLEANTTYAWDVTQSAQAMVDEQNSGFLLMGPSTGLANCTLLSSESGYGRPQIVIEYVAQPQVTPTPEATPTPEGKSLVAIVYHDFNRDGFKGASESGIPGTTIELLDGTTRAVISSATTDAAGQAEFQWLAADAYVVRELNLKGYVSTTADEQRVQMLGPVNYAYFGDARDAVIALPCITK